MDVLLMELIRRAESEGGENWLRQCLAAAPSREVEGRSELTRLEDDIEEAVSPAGSSLEVPSSAAAKRMKSAAESSLRVERSSGRSLQVPELERRRPTVSSKKVAHSAGSAQQVPAQLANPLARSLVRERETTGWSGTPSCSKDGVEDTAEAPASLVLEAAQDFSSELQPRKRSRKSRVAYSPPPPVSRRRRGPRSQLSCQQVSPGSTGTQQEVAEVVHDPGQVEQSVAEVQNDGTRSGALWNSVSSSFMESDLGLIYVNIQRSLAPRTWADYSAAWKEWVNFCVNENCNFFHNEVGLVLKFVHKSLVDPPGRPIVSGLGGLCDPVCKCIDYYLNPLVECLPSYVKYTTDVLARIDGISLEPDMFLVTADVESLYTSIQHNDGVDAVRLFLGMSNWDSQGTEAQLLQFMQELNVNDLNIRLTYIFDKQKIDFLDVSIEVDTERVLQTDVFRKETSVNSLLHATSAHVYSTINAVPVGQFLRMRRICSSETKFENQSRDLEERFRERRHSRRCIKQGYRRAKTTERKHLLYPLGVKNKEKEKNTNSFISTFNNQWQSMRSILKKHWNRP
ncbi:uncharacterized protein LOC142657444 [Rhinoderma darwinii]|uniref:uncharacterized protein LOC142657444 n=1 Tax=Rhinoderma darwinii TaxID=43563 RepID=UPI003F681A8F